MTDSWTETSLGEVVELKRGYDLPKKKRCQQFLHRVILNHTTNIRSPAPDGTIGTVHWVDKDYWPLNTALYVRDFKGNDQKFIYYFLKTIDYLRYSEKVPSRASIGITCIKLKSKSLTLPEERTTSGMRCNTELSGIQAEPHSLAVTSSFTDRKRRSFCCII